MFAVFVICIYMHLHVGVCRGEGGVGSAPKLPNISLIIVQYYYIIQKYLICPRHHKRTNKFLFFLPKKKKTFFFHFSFFFFLFLRQLLLEHHWWCQKFHKLTPQKITLFILPFHFTKHSTSVILF